MAGAIFTTQLNQNTADGLFEGIRLGFAAGGFVAALGILMSAIKEK